MYVKVVPLCSRYVFIYNSQIIQTSDTVYTSDTPSKIKGIFLKFFFLIGKKECCTCKHILISV